MATPLFVPDVSFGRISPISPPAPTTSPAFDRFPWIFPPTIAILSISAFLLTSPARPPSERYALSTSAVISTSILRSVKIRFRTDALSSALSLPIIPNNPYCHSWAELSFFWIVRLEITWHSPSNVPVKTFAPEEDPLAPSPPPIGVKFLPVISISLVRR